MQKILFVCLGNICRSPMAEYIMKKMVNDAGREGEFEISSAATSDEVVGYDIYPPAKDCLRLHNIPFEKEVQDRLHRRTMIITILYSPWTGTISSA